MAQARNHSPFQGDAQGYSPDYRKWWTARRQSEEPPHPYEFLLHFGIPERTVQSTCWEILASSCLHKDNSPGSVDSLVKKLFFKEHVQEPSYQQWQEHFGGAGRHGRLLMNVVRETQGTITEQDILSLVELFSMSLRHKTWLKVGHWTEFSIECLRHGFSSSLLLRVFGQLAISVSEPNHCFLIPDLQLGTRRAWNRPALDSACILGIQKILSKVGYLEIKEPKWTQRAYTAMLEMILHTSTTLHDLKLGVPKRFVEEPESDWIIPPLTFDDHPPCGVTRVCIEFEDFQPKDHGQPDTGALPTLQMLSRMPNLSLLSLNLQSFPLATAAPYLIQAVSCATTLNELNISVFGQPDDSADILHILETLKDTSCRIFRYREYGGIIALERRAIFHEKLVTVLEHNTSLRTVDFLDSNEDRDQGVPYDSPFGPQIGWYLDLNRHGRGKMRDPTTTLLDLVGLLHSSQLNDIKDNPFHSHFSDRVRSPYDRILNIYFGLLRESPGLWTQTVSHDFSALGNRKRKACDEL
jgi:hypothetical protein